MVGTCEEEVYGHVNKKVWEVDGKMELQEVVVGQTRIRGGNWIGYDRCTFNL